MWVTSALARIAIHERRKVAGFPDPLHFNDTSSTGGGAELGVQIVKRNCVYMWFCMSGSKRF